MFLSANRFQSCTDITLFVGRVIDGRCWCCIVYELIVVSGQRNSFAENSIGR